MSCSRLSGLFVSTLITLCLIVWIITIETWEQYSLVLTANQAANKSAMCQDKNDIDVLESSSSEVIVIVLSLLLTATVITSIVIIACLVTRHGQQLAAIRYEDYTCWSYCCINNHYNVKQTNRYNQSAIALNLMKSNHMTKQTLDCC